MLGKSQAANDNAEIPFCPVRVPLHVQSERTNTVDMTITGTAVPSSNDDLYQTHTIMHIPVTVKHKYD